MFATPAELITYGKAIAQDVTPGMVVYLEGDLGAGKTTMVKGIMAGLGYQGIVTSPTFSLLESYEMSVGLVHHFDCYRLESPDELEMIGGRELFNPGSICLVEWPDKAKGFLPEPDVRYLINYSAKGRKVTCLIKK